jgi:hypothetical protein
MLRNIIAVALFLCILVAANPLSADVESQVVDFRYAPSWWQTTICLPDDSLKTIVGKEGALLYDFSDKGAYRGFETIVEAGLDGSVCVGQSLISSRIPIVRTKKQLGSVDIEEDAFSVGSQMKGYGRCDILVVHFRNSGNEDANCAPFVTVKSGVGVIANKDDQKVSVGSRFIVDFTESFENFEQTDDGVIIRFPSVTLSPGEHHLLAVRIAGKSSNVPAHFTMVDAQMLRAEAENYWKNADIPYGAIQVPDARIQALLDSSIRNIYQAREIKDGLPVFQVGPTIYRGLWAIDGSFIIEAVSLIGRQKDARLGITYLLRRQNDEGGFSLLPMHWKETGVVLWAVDRHARLTGDKAWLKSVWPRIEKAVAFIINLRKETLEVPNAPNAGLVPSGFSDGGLGGFYPEYTNVYWSLIGLKSAISSARWIGKKEKADEWQKEFDSMMQCFKKAAERDMRLDSSGKSYLPIRMKDDSDVAAQRGQYAFLHAVFPGRLFSGREPFVTGNMAILEASEKEGLVIGTGWLPDGLWNYFGSFYAHALLWLGKGQKSADLLYAFANHASPLYCWREEQMPLGGGDQTVGDMPHNWASAEFIRLVRHLLVIERGSELHLFEGLPAGWIKPGAVIKLQKIATDFGPISMSLAVASDGSHAIFRFTPPERTRPSKIVLHLDGWSGSSGTRSLSVTAPAWRLIKLSRPAGGSRTSAR